MTNLPNIFDKYDRNARLWPAVLVISPALVGIATTFSAMEQGIPGYVIAVGVLIAALYVLMQIVRHLGRFVETRLWASWGGPPSTRFMLWSDDTYTEEWKRTVHDVVESALSMKLLSPEEEAENPAKATKLISDAFSQVKAILRMKAPEGEHQTHNIEYGFARNLLGGSLVAAGIAVLATVWCGVLAYLERDPWPVVGAVVCLGLAVGFVAARVYWLPSLAKLAADRYAEKSWNMFVELKRQPPGGGRTHDS